MQIVDFSIYDGTTMDVERSLHIQVMDLQTACFLLEFQYLQKGTNRKTIDDTG
jgi:hypothetical protein